MWSRPRRQAEQIVEGAKRYAVKVLEESQAKGREAGYKEGYTAGREQGHRDAHTDSIARFDQQHASIVSDMQQTIESIDAMKADLRITAESDLLDFAIRFASKLTFRVGELHREAAIENLRRGDPDDRQADKHHRSGTPC